MVKNLPSVERSQKIRLGKFTPDVQATDTIVINATSNDITTSDSGLYVAPIRYDATPLEANAIAYYSATKEIVSTPYSVDQTQTFHEVVSNGAVTTLGVEVSNTFTATRVQVGSGASADDVNVFVVKGGVLIEGNLVATGDTTFVRSNNVSITDPLMELGGNNNSESFVYDVGIIMNRPGENVGFAYLETRDELTVALTSNTATDRFIETSSNLLTMNVVGDVYANAFFGEGSTLTNVAHLVDFQSNVTRIGDLETVQESNASRVGVLETVQASNAQRLSTLETYHDDNVIRLNLLYNLQASNAAELTDLNAWHQSNVTRISNLETWLDDNSVRITNLSSNLADNSARISLLDTRLQDNSFRITTNSDNLSSNHYRLTNVESNLVANSNRLTSLTNTVNSIDGRVTVLESETSNLRVELDSNAAILDMTILDLSDNAGRVTNLELTKAPIHNPVFSGIIGGDGAGISNVDLQHVTSDGNATTDTVKFTSSTVAFVTDSTVGVGTDNPDTNYTLHATGDIKVASNVEATTFVAPGTHINLDGTNKLTGNTSVYGNLNVYGNVTYLDTENVYVKDPILGIGNPGAQDSGVIAMSGGPGSNVAFGYNNTDEEFIIAFTEDGPLGVTLTPNAQRDLNVHVYGTLYSANGFGVANTNPVSDTYALSIGTNVFAKHNGDLISIRSLADTGIYTSNVTTPTIESTGTNLEIAAPNMVVMGNLDVRGATTAVSTTDLKVNDTVVDLANNNTLTSVDLGIRMKRPGANVVMAYQASSEELAFAHSVSGVTPDTTKTMNVHVYGNLEVDNGINVGSNVIVNDLASNVIDADGGVAATIYYGDGGLLSNITQTLQGISEIGANTDQTIYFTNVTTGVNVTVSNVAVGGHYFGDGQFMTNVANLVILQSNVDILNTNIGSNVSDLRTDLQSNVSILNTNIGSNVSALRTDLQSNVTILKGEMASNTVALLADLQSNVSILNTNIGSNVSALRTDLQSNVSILNTNITSNVADLRTDLQSNVSILNTNIGSNVSALRTDLQSNVSILNTNIGSNVSALRSDLQSNVGILNTNIGSNVSTLRTDLQSNVSILNTNIGSNVSALRTDLQSNVSILNTNITSNVADLRTDLQSNVSILNTNITSNVNLKANILDPTFSSNITVSNNLVMSDLTATRVVFVGANKQLTDDAALEFSSSTLTLDGDLSVSGNLAVEGQFTKLETVNTIVNDAIIELGNNNSSDTLDLGLIMTRPSTNVAVGYRGDESEFFIGHTLSDPSSTDLVPDSANALAVHVYGSMTSNSLDVHGTANVGALTSTELDVLGTANVGALTMTGATLNGDFDMVSTDGSSSAGPEFTLWKNSATPTSGDYLGQIKFAGENSTGGKVNYAKMTGKISDETAGAEDGLIEYAVKNNGSFNPCARLTHTDLKLINGTGLEVDGESDLTGRLAVAHDTDTPSFFGRAAVGHATGSSSDHAAFAHLDNNTGTDYAIKQSAAGATFINAKSGSRVAFSVANSEKMRLTSAGKLGINETNPQYQLDVGGEINATLYRGDGGLLSNIASNLEQISTNGNIVTSNTLQFMNAQTAFVTNSSADVGVKLEQLTEITIGGKSSNDVLLWNGAAWVNSGILATYSPLLDPTFTSNVSINEGLVVNKNSVASKQYAYTGSMTYSNVGVTFSTNVFSARITAHLVHDDDEVSTMQIECCGGSKNGTSTHNIVTGKVNKFGVSTSYPWKHEVTTTPTQVIWEPEQTGSTNYDYDIHVELLSSHPSAGVTQITEAGSAVKYFSY